MTLYKPAHLIHYSAIALACQKHALLHAALGCTIDSKSSLLFFAFATGVHPPLASIRMVLLSSRGDLLLHEFALGSLHYVLAQSAATLH